MKTGFAEADITPLPGTQRAGAYSRLLIQGVRDPLKVRASVFDDGREALAIVGLDTCMIGRSTVARARRLIAERSGLKPENIMIAASHTHSGASLWGFRAEELEDAPELIRRLALEISASVDINYEELVVRKLCDAVLEAFAQRKETLLSIGKGQEGAAVFNRRFLMRQGGAFTHPGKGNPDILKAAGPIDPELNVLGAWDSNGKLSGCIVNYACHGTAYSQMNASADWICAMEKTIRASFGEELVVVFLNGACGDVTQVDNLSTRQHRSPEEYLNIIGTRVGAEALKVLISSERGALAPLRASTEKIRVKRRSNDSLKTRQALELVQRLINSEGQEPSEDFIWAKERLLADYIAAREPEKEFELQAFQIGPAIFLANPSEFFCSLGLRLKREASHFPFVFVVELANDCIGYVPDEDAFGPGGGGYETRLTSYSNLETGTGGKIIEALAALAKKFLRGRRLKGRGGPGPTETKPPNFNSRSCGLASKLRAFCGNRRYPV